MPSIMWWAAKFTQFHALEAQARASSAPKVTTAANSSSAPPTRFGWWMRMIPVSWKSRSVSSGRRRSSSHFAARSRNAGSRDSAFSQSCLFFCEPVKNLLSSPQMHARALPNVVEQLFDVADAMRHAADIGVQADRHHARARFALLIEAIEMIDAAAQPLLRGMLLQQHH